MITMRSTSNKTAKPPPPIPPRPSKALVAESLAKLRRSPEHNRNVNNDDNGLSPTRIAPPPPQYDLSQNEVFIPVTKSQSHSTVNLINDHSRIHKIQRSASITEEDHKINTRTVIFQSPNIKTSRLELKLKRTESDRKQGIENENKTISLSNSMDDLNVTTKSDAADVALIEGGSSPIHNTNGDDTKIDEWNELLNGKNHVNTLIDEMFASILDPPQETITEALYENTQTLHTTPVDATKIVIKNEINGHRDEIPTATSTPNPEISPHPTTVLISDPFENEIANEEGEKTVTNNRSETRKKNSHVKFDDKKNHELLITELQNMRMEQERILKRQRSSPQELYDEIDDGSPKIQHSDWVEVNNGQEIRLSSCQIIIEDGVNSTITDPVISRLNMSSLHGLPPLPKSLSGFSLIENQRNNQTPSRSRGSNTPVGFISGQVVYPPHPRAVNGTTEGRKPTNLDNQLAILRREMVSFTALLFMQIWETLRFDIQFCNDSHFTL
ncbi:uncharacterized protein LOC116162379 [Photinus pyralis]|uniref:uncharacterized protein LOC116162379 n=1 Tax=Photinus pyralis TaxID=7054 RepID=UPI001266E63F|nr:uncharacterized protein LOC116162379 [Photinus pyralis]